MKPKLLQKKLLIIAGSDPSGGAGIQADIKTAAAHNIYSSAAITCLTAQNSQGVFAIDTAPIDFLKKQIEVLFDDISYDAIKIGMLGNSKIINAVSEILNNKAKKIPVILDSVMVATSGDILLESSAIESLKSNLLNLSHIVTPNIDEAQILANIKIKNLNDMKLAAKIIKKLGSKNVLIKGGHLNFKDNKIRSILLDNKNKFHIITNKKIGTKNLHGTGCTLSSAISCNIAKGLDTVTSVRKANKYVYKTIKNSQEIGKGSLLLKH